MYTYINVLHFLLDGRYYIELVRHGDEQEDGPQKRPQVRCDKQMVAQKVRLFLSCVKVIAICVKVISVCVKVIVLENRSFISVDLHILVVHVLIA